MGQDQHQGAAPQPTPAPAGGAPARAATGGRAHTGVEAVQRDLSERLAQGASAQDIGVFVGSHVPPAQRDQAIAFLHQHKGNAFVQSALAAAGGAAHGPLSGAMLVSNNPEGLSTTGTIVSAQAKAGPLAAYVHHSNHTAKPMDLYLVVKPASGSVTTTLSGSSATDGGSKRAKGKAPEAWASDPNAVVAAANTAKMDGNTKDPNLENRVNLSKTGTGATPIKLGTLPAGRPAVGYEPLFDGRYDLELSGDAEVEVVAEAAGASSGSAATKDTHAAIGNTKYELDGGNATNGRAAGMYAGASFASDDTAYVSSLPFKKPLTGSKFTPSTPSPVATERERVTAPSAATIAGAAGALKTSVDHAAVYVLEHVFRIAAAWLTEKGVWNGTTLTTNGLTADYAAIIDELKTALAADRNDPTLPATRAMIASHSSVGAGLDAASYGTMFELGVLIDNDTDKAASIDLDFLTDASAAARHAKGAVWRGVVAVDGVEHPINNDTAGGNKPSADLGGAEIAPDHSKFIHVAFQSPGQVSQGQELDIKRR